MPRNNPARNASPEASPTPAQTETKPVVTVVSACLLGRRCRYNAIVRSNLKLVEDFERERSSWIPVCPEELGGLGTPRPPADIVKAGESGTGEDVLEDRARVVTEAGDDVTAAFRRGAERALEIAIEAGAQRALLKTRSPSCGCGSISNSRYGETGGYGVFAELCRRAGIETSGVEFDAGDDVNL